MKSISSVARHPVALCMLLTLPMVVSAESILVDQPKGSILQLTQKDEPGCGTVNWGSVRQSGSITIDGQAINMGEPKLPLSKLQWETLLTKTVGNQEQITIAHAWNKGPAGLAAALRIAYDIRSHGGTAWVFNGPIGDNKPVEKCAGEYKFRGEPVQIYLSEEQFWKEITKGAFMDARGRGAQEPPSYTWVVGSPVKAKAIDIASFTMNDKVDKDVYSCEEFKDVSVAGCDSLHKTFLAVEAAKYANCDSQPKLMPYWGLAGASRHMKVAKKVWGEEVELNEKRSGEIAN